MSQGKRPGHLGGAMRRRTFLKAWSAGALAATLPTVITGKPAFAAGQLTIRDGGGSTGETYKRAFYDPFTKETGIVINQVTVRAGRSDQTDGGDQ